MIRALFWNCRGIGNNPTITDLSHLVASHSPDLIFLAEPLIQFPFFQAIRLSFLGYDSFLSKPHHPCKSQSKFTCSLLDSSNQHLSISIMDSSTNQSSIMTGIYGSTNFRIRRDLWQYLISCSSTTLPRL